MKKVELSLILPCYNEAEHFRASSEKILTILKKSGITFEVIFVEDQSQDRTWELICGFIKKHPKLNLRAVRHQVNQGRGQTVTDGIKAARGEIVGFIDIDCEVSPEYIPDFVKKIKAGWDVVCGDRKYKTTASGLLRAVSSKLYSLLVRVLLETRLLDTEAGYKFFKKEKILSILPLVKDKGWFWDTEAMVRSELRGLAIAFIPVKFERRTDKASTVNLISDTFAYLKNLWRFRQELLLTRLDKKTEIDRYWYEKANVFSDQYIAFLGIPLTPVGWFLHQRYQLISHLLRPLPGQTFLDVGCGPGIFMRAALEQGRCPIGIDYSTQMIETARKTLLNYPKASYQLLKANAADMPLKKKSVDIILASGLTDYLTFAATEKFMQEVARLLKLKGYVILTFPKSDSWFRFLRQGVGLKLRKQFLGLPAIATAYSKEDVKKLLRQANLKPLKWDEVLGTMRVVLAQKL